jgi:hypothetical protein
LFNHILFVTGVALLAMRWVNDALSVALWVVDALVSSELARVTPARVRDGARRASGPLSLAAGGARQAQVHAGQLSVTASPHQQHSDDDLAPAVGRWVAGCRLS